MNGREWGRINAAPRKEVIFSACNRTVALREIKEEDWTGLFREKVVSPPIALLQQSPSDTFWEKPGLSPHHGIPPIPSHQWRSHCRVGFVTSILEVE